MWPCCLFHSLLWPHHHVWEEGSSFICQHFVAEGCEYVLGLRARTHVSHCSLLACPSQATIACDSSVMVQKQAFLPENYSPTAWAPTWVWRLFPFSLPLSQARTYPWPPFIFSWAISLRQDPNSWAARQQHSSAESSLTVNCRCPISWSVCKTIWWLLSCVRCKSKAEESTWRGDCWVDIHYQQFKIKEGNHQTFKQNSSEKTRCRNSKRSSSRTKVQSRSVPPHLPAVVWPKGTHWVMEQGWWGYLGLASQCAQPSPVLSMWQ